MTTAIIDYDVGNLAAVKTMLRRVGEAAVITANPDEVERADRIILPGNGNFDTCMRNIRATGLIPLLEERVLRQKVPLLGICVGAQMLGLGSEEGVEPGLGWLGLKVRRFPDLPGLRVPHMGWANVERLRPEHPLLSGLDESARFYFVHSYFLEPTSGSLTLLTADYGMTFVAGIAEDNIAGVQFHPEKSHRYGKALLGNFAKRSR